MTESKHGLYSDLFWTPLIAQALAVERKKDSEMVRALFSAIELHSGKCVTLSHLYRALPRADLWLQAYEDIFELVPDGSNGGWQAQW
eukprot:Skav236728  [mRNA]  locus=scaffold2654:6898:12195:- [translate_table: standard]